MNYYPHHIGDYAAATRGLSLMEHGAYRVMLDLYYLDEKPLPADTARLCRALGARTRDEKAAVCFVAACYFRKEGRRLHHKRCDEEIAGYHAVVERNRANGRKGGRPLKRASSGSGSAAADGGARLTRMPPGFGLSERVRAWAAEQGHDRLEQRLAHFTGYARRRAARYADWDEALMCAIREDWARLDPPRARPAPRPVAYLRDGEVM